MNSLNSSLAEQRESSYEQKRAKYFGELALKHLSLMRLHKEFGLLPRKEGFGNVTEHCLTEAAAAEVIADELGLSVDSKQKLVEAPLIHDFYKRREVERTREDRNSARSFDAAAKSSRQILLDRGIDKDIVEIADYAGHNYLGRMMELLGRMDSLSEVERLQLIFHYLDDITLNNDFVMLKSRIDMLESNPKYKVLNESGRDQFEGMATFSVQRAVGQKIEKWLAKAIGLDYPNVLPWWIREEVQSKIETV